jgi:site-specific DNA recombinase
MPSTNGHGPESDVGKVALYLRVSSEEQRDRETIEIQREFLEQYSSLYELEVAEIYEDDGVSGTIPLHERPEGRRLLQDAKEGMFGAVLIYKLDRLGRTLLVIVDAHDRLQEAGVALRSATEPIDTSNPSGRLIFQMLASFAEYERETIGERTRAGLHRAYRNGKHTGRIPYGYRIGEDGRLEVVEEEAAIVREIIANVAAGSTLYQQSKRLNDHGVPSPGWRFKSGERKHGKGWSRTTVAAIVHQSAYSGVHKVRVGSAGGAEECIEREVLAVVDPVLQERAKATLAENKRFSNRKGDRKYLLSGLVRCAVCGTSCTGCATTNSGKEYRYYKCTAIRNERISEIPRHRAPCVIAPWLEDLVWQDVKSFLENPGEILERVREQLKGDDDTEELARRREGLAQRLATKHSEKDRYVRLYAQGHIFESELEVYLADLKNQTDNLRLLIESLEADLSKKRKQTELTETTAAWLIILRERIAEVEEDTEEAFGKRRQLVKLLVEGITAGKKEGRTEVRITYRFDPPGEAQDGEEAFLSGVQNSSPNLRSK